MSSNMPRSLYSRFSFKKRRPPPDDILTNTEQKVELLSEPRSIHCHGVIDAGHDGHEQLSITGYRRSSLRTFFCFIGFVITGGLMRLVMHWYQHWLLLCTHVMCPLETAEKILVTENYQGKHTVHYVKDVITVNAKTIASLRRDNRWQKYMPTDADGEAEFQGLSMHTTGGVFKCIDSLRMFRCKQLRYYWDADVKGFVQLRGMEHDVPSVNFHSMKGLNRVEQYARCLVYGANQIIIPIKGVFTLLFLEVLNPFYVFQVFSVCLWFSYDYHYYAAVIILMSAFGITMSILQTRKNQRALYSTVSNADCATVIMEDGTTQLIETKFLVPGDIMEIPSTGCTMQCDAVLLSGNAILDESMLTGESVPVTKTPLPCRRDVILHIKEHNRHMLFCGTKVIQTRYIGSERVRAVVINTGNITAKGELIRSILYPPPVDYKFENDSYKFIMFLGIIAGFGFVYTLVTKIMRGVSAAKIAIESLDLITIAVPPALPAAMTVGRLYAQQRLKVNNIYCISPRSINVSGSIDCVCFDKTGTLTEDGLDMWGVVPTHITNQFQIPLRQIERLEQSHCLFCMVTCHSLTRMNGELRGDPLDLKMFESTGWILEEANVADDTKYDLLFPTTVRPPRRNSIISDVELDNDSLTPNGLEIGIVREFSFTSSLQRMSVITRNIGDNHFNVYCKGSPEMIATLCRPDSLPDNFNSKLDEFAQQGYRVIALAYKPLSTKLSYAKVQKIPRDRVEVDLEFQGFVVLENRLKDDTTAVISVLKSADIRTIMVTGDNILTALSVAKDCGMLGKSQSVIIVNCRPCENDATKYELYYNLAGQSNMVTPGAHPPYPFFRDEFSNNSITNSNSVASFATVDTCTQMTTDTNADVELGYARKHKNTNGKTCEDHDSNNYRFAMVGKTWVIIKEQYPDLLAKFVTRGTIFARMSPDQKQSLILELQGLGYYVAMCGDGANDCGALKAAHTGISLSDAESSVASPFTSKNPTIKCVPNVIKEGRAALVTSFGIFKYMAAYSLVQFASVLILYSIDSNLTDIEFLYIDLFIISIFAFFFGKTESYDGPLVKQTPLNSLISVSPIASLILHMIVAIGFQVAGWYHLQNQDWFVPFNLSTHDNEFDHACMENYTIFIISCFQYIILAFVFSKGAPYRKSIISNRGFLICIVVNTAFTIWMALDPPQFVANAFQLELVPEQWFRAYLVFYGIANLILSVFIERFIIEHLFFKKLRYRFHNTAKSRRQYLPIEEYLRNDRSWPPLSDYHNELKTDGEDKVSPTSYAEISVEAQLDIENHTVLDNFFEPTNNNAEVVLSPPTETSSKNDSGIGVDITSNGGGGGDVGCASAGKMRGESAMVNTVSADNINVSLPLSVQKLPNGHAALELTSMTRS